MLVLVSTIVMMVPVCYYSDAGTSVYYSDAGTSDKRYKWSVAQRN